MIKIYINYYFRGVPEDEEFSCIHTYDKTHDIHLYTCNMPFMVSGDLLTESPSASPYSIPLPVGIKKCYVEIIPVNIAYISIRGAYFNLPIETMLNVPTHNQNLGIKTLGSQGVYKFTNVLFKSPTEAPELVGTSPVTYVYSGNVKFPVKYHKSPGNLFTVDGSGNTITIQTRPGIPLPSDLFKMNIYNIEFGGVPSPDY